jgi:hypothetical protein
MEGRGRIREASEFFRVHQSSSEFIRRRIVDESQELFSWLSHPDMRNCRYPAAIEDG